MADDEVAPALTRRRVLPVGGALLAAVALQWPAPAHAIDPGVIYDPGSPAGKQYAIPLEQARHQAGSPGHETGSPTYTAFGVGIKPPGGGSSGGGGGSGGQGAGGTGGSGRHIAHGRASGGQPAANLGKRLRDAESAGSSTPWTLWILLAVLVPGATLGLALNRLQRGPAT